MSPLIPAAVAPIVLELIREIDRAFRHGGECEKYACQLHPELRLDKLPDAGEEMDSARAEALRRADAQADALRQALLDAKERELAMRAADTEPDAVTKEREDKDVG